MLGLGSRAITSSLSSEWSGVVAGVGVVAVSLRHFFPEPWDGMGHGFTIAQYVVNMVAFIENLGVGTLCLMGHTRGGHIAFRLAQRRAGPLAEAGPGARRRSGYFSDRRSVSSPPLCVLVAAAAEKIAAGDIDGGLSHFLDAIEGQREGCACQRQQSSGYAITPTPC